MALAFWLLFVWLLTFGVWLLALAFGFWLLLFFVVVIVLVLVDVVDFYCFLVTIIVELPEPRPGTFWLLFTTCFLQKKVLKLDSRAVFQFDSVVVVRPLEV